MDAVAQALADPIRREILLMLREAPRTAGAIADAFPVSRPAVSRHLRVLRGAVLVRDTVNGREHEYALVPGGCASLETFLAQLRGPSRWDQRLDALGTEVHRVRRKRKGRELALEENAAIPAKKRKIA